MTQPQRTRRGYNADGRRAQALANREKIVLTARELFVEQGYAGVSVAEIAAAAGVSAPTVFAQFGSKVQLLKEVAETALVGDLEPEPVAVRPRMVQVREAPTAGEVLDRLARLAADWAPRACPIFLVVYAAADSDPQIAELAAVFDAQRLDGAAQLAEALMTRPDYPQPVSAGERGAVGAKIRDTIWTLNSPLMYRLLVVQRGWSVEQYGEWFRLALRSLCGVDGPRVTP